jgi:YegS/Rv2252/BmrU family lipid kinase
LSPPVLIFANPIAGRGRGKVVARRLEKELRSVGIGAQIFLQPPAELSAADINRSAIAAISIGGDGTLRQVASLLLAGGENQPPLLPLPMGTANLMAKHLGLHGGIDAVVDTIRRQHVVRLDAARANGELLLLVAGVGFDGLVVHLLDEMRKGPITLISYVLPTLLTLRDYKFPAITVEVDGSTVARNLPAVAFVGNIREYGVGAAILTEARSDDGLLDICVLPCRDYRDLAEILVLLATEEHTKRDGVIYLRGKSVHVHSNQKIPIQIDGEAAGFTPLQVDILPAAVPFLVPL